MESVILVAGALKTQLQDELSLQELSRLAQTAGAKVLKVYNVRVNAFNAATLIGRGKAEEIAAAAAQLQADAVIFDDEITPAQQNNLEEIIPAKVLDRTRLILDIFARRARTQEGKLQVELAQLSYLLPRLSGRGAAMMQQKGGIGLRGPGERKLEYDRRRLRARIAKLEKDIEQVKKERALRRQRRGIVPLPQIALIGYTNAGKSTLLNALARGEHVYADDKLFATLDPTTRRVPLRKGGSLLFTDTVGFIQKLPHALVSAFRATLEETQFADVLLHVRDASSAQLEEQEHTVRRILTQLCAAGTPVIDVFNKTDALSPARLRALRAANPQAVLVSAKNKKGLPALIHAVEKALHEKWRTHTLRLQAGQTAALGEIYRRALVLHTQTHENGSMTLRVLATEGNCRNLLEKLTGAD